MSLEACIFDLDGVIVDTAVYHYKAWNRLAESFGYSITDEDNEQLKGVSRMASLDFILGLGKIEKTEAERIDLAKIKNDWYLESIQQLSDKDILPGVPAILEHLKTNNIKIALGSASKNSKTILKAIDLIHYFDHIVDGNDTTKGKPDPQVFLMGAAACEVEPAACIVFEDSLKGLQAANTGGFKSFGVGDPEVLNIAMHTQQYLTDVDIDFLTKTFYTEA